MDAHVPPGPKTGTPCALPIEDYALVGDCITAALVGRNGSVDWLCWPRFDSAACFAALLGTEDNGRFLLCPADAGATSTRRYRDHSLVLETLFTTAEGEVALLDFMVPGAGCSTMVRIVEGRSGQVPMRMELLLRFDYGMSVPWVTQRQGGNGIVAVAGPEMVVLRTSVPLRGEQMRTLGDFTVSAGERTAFTLTHSPSHLPLPHSLDAEDALYSTEAYWAEWASRCTYDGPWAGAVLRSLLTLKCLTYAPTGGIVAAPTTSLPEMLGGTRNWDYRFCWLRDATITLFAFMGAGYTDEARSWADWLHRSIAGSPEQVQIMYGISGERRLAEWEVPWLAGYQGAAPVRVGNAAAGQLQLDIYGEVMAALHQARRAKLLPNPQSWALQRAMRDLIHETVCRDGFDAGQGSFTQVFGKPALDASLLLIPAVNFLPYGDLRVRGTVAAIERGLVQDGFVLRYRAEGGVDGLPDGEGAFLACSFWLVAALQGTGRTEDARRLFERLLGLRNDVGLLAEEYDPRAGRLTGNFPQAFSHVALVTAAMALGQSLEP